MSYGTVAQLCTRINLDVSDLTEARETAYEEILEAISTKIDLFCGRPEGFVAGSSDSDKYLDGGGHGYLRIPECISITTVAVKDAYSDTSYTAWSSPATVLAGDGDWLAAAGSHKRPIFNRTPYTLLMVDPNGDYSTFTNGYGTPTTKITAKWGYAVTVPDPVREACLAQAAVLLKRFETSMSSQGADDDLGVMAQKIRQTALSRDIKDLLLDSHYALPLYGRQY